MADKYKTQTQYHFVGPSGEENLVHVCIKWDIENPLIVVGQWQHPPRIGDFVRQEGYIAEWASLGVQMIEEERAMADCDDHNVPGGRPTSIGCYELLKSNCCEREYPVAECKIKWSKNDENLVGIEWSAEQITREWKRSPCERIKKKISWILDGRKTQEGKKKVSVE